MCEKSSFASMPRNYESGGVMVFGAIICLALCGILALAVDAFFLRASHMQVSNNAEYAALAAVKAVAVENLSIESARRRAERVAGLNFYVGSTHDLKSVQAGELDMSRERDSRAGEIIFGKYDSDTGTFEQVSDCSSICNAVQIRLWTASGRHLHPLFSGIWGYQQIQVASTATAYFDQSAIGGSRAPFFIVEPTQPA